MLVLIILLTATNAHATGWLDYKLDIGDGYTIWRNNSIDINVANSEDRILIGFNDNNNPVGPVVAYAATDQFIFTRNLGKKQRNLFEGDTFQNVDPEQEYFFILTKKTDSVVGPLTNEKFNSRAEIKASSPIIWEIPQNPNFWLPLFGTLMFLLVSLPILAMKFSWITIPVSISIVFLVWHFRRKRRLNASTGPTHQK